MGGRLAAAAALLCVAAVAQASPLYELVGATQGPGGWNARAMPAHAASAYFNPAFLVEAEEGFDLGLFVASDQIGITLLGRPGRAADISEASLNMERPGGGRYEVAGVPTRWLEAGRPATPPDAPLAARPRQAAGSSQQVHTYQILGFVQRLAGGRLAVGLTAMLPYRRFTSAQSFYNDEREQYFSNSLHPELYADRLTTTSLAFGLGARVHPRLLLGLSASLGLHTVARTPTYVSDVGRFSAIKVDSDVGVQTALSPQLGLVYAPGPQTRLCATAHTPQKLEIDTDFSFLLASGIEQAAKVGFTHGYLPWIFGLGGSQRLGGSAAAHTEAVATVTLSLWSQYRDRHSERPAAAYAWSNTVAGVLGLRHVRGGSTTYGDVAFTPSPVPDQTGRSNYVDNHRVGLLLGEAWSHSYDWGSLRLGVSAQVHRLLPRSVLKSAPGNGVEPAVVDEVPDDAVVGGVPLAGREGLQTNNPGWPGFSSQGWILGAGINLGVGF
jgi:long-chain fatty acid transport protein